MYSTRLAGARGARREGGGARGAGEGDGARARRGLRGEQQDEGGAGGAARRAGRARRHARQTRRAHAPLPTGAPVLTNSVLALPLTIAFTRCLVGSLLVLTSNTPKASSFLANGRATFKTRNTRLDIRQLSKTYAID